MKERPILFSAPMVRAILDGRKTQTRRIVRPQPTGEQLPLSDWSRGLAAACHDSSPDPSKLAQHSEKLVGRIFPFTTQSGVLMSPSCPYGHPGDRLWVRENLYLYGGPVEFAADGPPSFKRKLTPSIHMPRTLSRITLEVTGVRVERLQEISEQDALAEGVTARNAGQDEHGAIKTYRTGFVYVWQEINAKRAPWASNPWCWVLTFKRLS